MLKKKVQIGFLALRHSMSTFKDILMTEFHTHKKKFVTFVCPIFPNLNILVCRCEAAPKRFTTVAVLVFNRLLVWNNTTASVGVSHICIKPDYSLKPPTLALYLNSQTF